jgi:hypothetical protein
MSLSSLDEVATLFRRLRCEKWPLRGSFGGAVAVTVEDG